jgi:DNA-binding IclR family transcriptional regulator
MPKSSLRVLDMLELLAGEQKALSHSELSLRMGIPKSSLTGLLNDLVERRYVAFEEDTRRYSLGAQVLAISQGYLEQLSVTRVGRPILSEVLQLVNENSALSIRDGTENVVIAQETCTHPLKQTMVIGSRSPLHCTASGKTLLAFLPEPEREAILCKLRLERVTRRTITDRDKFRRHLMSVQDNGYAVSDEEAIEGVLAIAVPVMSATGVAASLSTAIPISRLTDRLKRTVIDALRGASEKLSAALGGASRPAAEPAARRRR